MKVYIKTDFSHEKTSDAICVLHAFCLSFFATLSPFLFANAMAKPLSGVMQILAKHKDVVSRSSGLAEMFRPFFGFLQFCLGKLLFTVFLVFFFLPIIIPNFIAKPFTVYVAIGTLMLSPLGLHFYLAYQEFVFYSFCSYYRTFAKLAMESSEAQPMLTTTKPTGSNKTEVNNPVTYHAPRYDAPRRAFHERLETLVDLMKNMTEAFGPFLVQNFSLMLFYWILHVYYVCYIFLHVFRNLSDITHLYGLALTCVQLTGGVLIVR